MKIGNLKFLVLAVLALIGTVILLSSTRHSTSTVDAALYPDLADNINDIKQLRITRNGEITTISKTDGGWSIVERGGFPADADKILETVLAIAEARTLETKTADPDRHEQLGVEEPVGENGAAISIFGDDFEYSLIVGKTAQTRYRYVRKAGDNQSWMIDRNPAIPEDIGEWLQSDLANIGAERIESVSISHADGETISIGKESEDNSNYDVNEIPPGRELSYPAVANGIAAVLGDLTFDDVQKSGTDSNIATTTTFVTRDGLEVVVESVADVEPDDNDTDENGEPVLWFSFSASGGDDSEAITFNERTSGWEYRLPDHKADLLVRRWEDLLKTPEE